VKSALLATTGLLLSTAVLATACGGGSDTMRATLTDDGCTYEGDTTPAPGSFNIEIENKTSRYAIFIWSTLAAGKTVEDVRHAVERGRPASEVVMEDAGGGAHAGPHETNVIPVITYGGRLVILCWLHTSAEAPQSDILPAPAAVYVVPVELEVS
jgi:hypothetical protein